MKKIIFVVCLVLVMLIIFSASKITIAYSSNPTLYFDGGSFKFINVKNNDLFTNFKDLMPGDVKTQAIDINLNKINNESKLYMKLINNDEFLNNLRFKIYKDNNVIFDNVNDFEKYNTPIIIYNQGESKNFQLKIDLEIPIEIGNEIEEISDTFEWQFLIEDYGEEIKEVPKTGDNIYFYIILMNISLIVLLFTVMKLKKQMYKQ